jgi:hypothetical protein
MKMQIEDQGYKPSTTWVSNDLVLFRARHGKRVHDGDGAILKEETLTIHKHEH